MSMVIIQTESGISFIREEDYKANLRRHSAALIEQVLQLQDDEDAMPAIKNFISQL